MERTKMSFRRVNEQLKLAGFWTRKKDSILQGIVKKHVPKANGPFYIFELTAPCSEVINDKGKNVKTKIGDCVGCSASKTLEIIHENYMDSHVKLTALDKVPHKTRKKDGKPVMMPTFDIEVDIPEE